MDFHKSSKFSTNFRAISRKSRSYSKMRENLSARKKSTNKIIHFPAILARHNFDSLNMSNHRAPHSCRLKILYLRGFRHYYLYKKEKRRIYNIKINLARSHYKLRFSRVHFSAWSVRISKITTYQNWGLFPGMGYNLTNVFVVLERPGDNLDKSSSFGTLMYG